VAAAFAGLAAFFLAAVAIAFEGVSPYVLFEGVPAWLTALSALALAAVALSALLPVQLARGRGWSHLARLHFALLCAGALVFALLLWTYNFLGVIR
jgi:hypothetical protein